MSISNLKKWPILSLLEPEFIATIRMVAVYGDASNMAVIVTKDDMVYGLGRNINGLLGTGDSFDTFSPRVIKDLCKKGIKTFAYGTGPHVLALTDDGKVYGWGCNKNGQVGNTSHSFHSKPVPIKTPSIKQMVINVACGDHHSLALTHDGAIYAWGRNNCGQVGNDTSQDQITPWKVDRALMAQIIVSISCGNSYSVAVTSKGKVYSWGSNAVGQLGHENCNNSFVPKLISDLEGVIIKKVVCGHSHTLALSEQGSLYAWGNNDCGQLGVGTKNSVRSPLKIGSIKMGPVIDMAASHYNNLSVAMEEGGKVFIWGLCLGLPITEPTPTFLVNMHDAMAYYAIPKVMHCPLIIYAAEETSIAGCLRKAFNDPTTSDLTIEVQEQPIYVHKVVLQLRSQYFRNMFQTCWDESNKSIIKHDQFSYNVYKSFLKYLYTNEVDLPLEDEIELLHLSEMYVETQLKHQCVQAIKRRITVLNVINFYTSAIVHKSQELEDFCFNVIINHMTEVVQSPDFATLDETVLKKFILKAALVGAFKR